MRRHDDNETLPRRNRGRERKARSSAHFPTLAEQQKQIEALTDGLQKVNAQLQASKPAPQVVNNP